ncbi:hypothetical protein MRB53_038182 [Persea americana]|nr:hypothetical protein MRB53_038182 [Persea americana]
MISSHLGCGLVAYHDYGVRRSTTRHFSEQPSITSFRYQGQAVTERTVEPARRNMTEEYPRIRTSAFQRAGKPCRGFLPRSLTSSPGCRREPLPVASRVVALEQRLHHVACMTMWRPSLVVLWWTCYTVRTVRSACQTAFSWFATKRSLALVSIAEGQLVVKFDWCWRGISSLPRPHLPLGC